MYDDLKQLIIDFATDDKGLNKEALRFAKNHIKHEKFELEKLIDMGYTGGKFMRSYNTWQKENHPANALSWFINEINDQNYRRERILQRINDEMTK